MSPEDRQALEDFVQGAYRYNLIKRARLAYVVEGILHELGYHVRGMDFDAFIATARHELGRVLVCGETEQCESLATPLRKDLRELRIAHAVVKRILTNYDYVPDAQAILGP